MCAKRLPAAGLAVLAVLAFGACGRKAVRDEFADATLRQATRGRVVSMGFRYEFRNPRIVAVHNSIGIIREGNLLEFVGGRSLQGKLAGLEGALHSLCVVKEFSPFVHFRVERIHAEADTVFIANTGGIDYPTVIPEDEFDRSGFAEYDLGGIPYGGADMIESIIGGAYSVRTGIAEEEENGSPVYMLVAGDNKFRVLGASDGISAILQLLAHGNHPFDGGITLASREPFETRRNTKIIGNVRIDFVRYGRTIVSE
ncbi:MAG: hypothetical protein HY770_09040 [Chitinivibrionia bacterium]|nr:hypothetical protein [Chitinivibrionia bacterium]